MELTDTTITTRRSTSQMIGWIEKTQPTEAFWHAAARTLVGQLSDLSAEELAWVADRIADATGRDAAEVLAAAPLDYKTGSPNRRRSTK